jgi:hypothetical protein
MADLLDRITSEIDTRRAELRPLIEEHDRLQAAIAALAGIDGAPSTAATPVSSRRRVRPRAVTPIAEAAKQASGRRARGRRRRGGRPKGGGRRAAQALAAITKQPGITIPELAKKMGVNPTYLYRVVPGLAKEGKVVKDGKGYWPSA